MSLLAPRPVVYLLVAMLAFVLGAGAANAQQVEVAYICNADGSESVEFAVIDRNWNGGAADGWYVIAPNQCTSVWRWSADKTMHDFIFMGNGKPLDLIWDYGWKGSGFCVDVEHSFTYKENFLLHPDRSKKCEGQEAFVEANIGITNYGQKYNLNIPAWSGGGSPNDGKTCSAFGICISYPGLDTSHLKEAALARQATPVEVETSKVAPPIDIFRQSGWVDATFEMMFDISRQTPFDGVLKSNRTTKYRAFSLDYFPGAYLVALTDEEWPVGQLVAYLYKANEALVRLDGGPGVGEFAKKYGVNLNEWNVGSYLWLNRYFTQSKDGPYLIAETAETSFVPATSSMPKDKADTMMGAYAKMRPLVCTHVRVEFKCEGTMLYSNSLFTASFKVGMDGSASLSDFEAIAVDLPYSQGVRVRWSE